MSYQITQSVSGNNKRSGKTVESYQSVWMARWSGTSSIAEAEQRKCSVSEYGNLPNGLEISRSVKGPGIIEDRNSDLSLRSRGSGSKAVRNFRLGQCQNTGEIQALRTMFGLGAERGKGEAPLSSSTAKSASVSRNQLPCANMRMLEHENCPKVGPSSDLFCGEQMKSSSRSHASRNVHFKESDRSAIFDAPSTNDHQRPTLAREWFEKMHKSSGFLTLFRGERKASGETESKKSHRVGDLETARVCATVDALATTHSLLITKKTEVNLLKEDETFGSSAKMNDGTSSDFHRASPFSGLGKQGVKLQSLSSSSDSGGKINFGNEASKIATKNESSAETDTLEINILKTKKPNAGSSSTPSTEVLLQLNPSLDSKTESIGCQLMPDINVALPALPAAESSENMCRSSSRTETLEMEIPLDHAEQPKPSFKFNLNDTPDADPSNRWIKRLKLSSSNSSALGTKSSNLSENSSHGKTSLRLRTIPQSSITSSPRYKNTNSSKVDEDTNIDSTKKAKNFLLSHAWTRRLLHKGSKAARKKTEMICEPQSSKSSLEDLQTKQFPSVAAMALVGKTMSGFRPCKTQKKGALTVWNTNSF